MKKYLFTYDHAISILLEAKKHYKDLTEFILYYEDKLSPNDYDDILFEFEGLYDKTKIGGETNEI